MKKRLSILIYSLNSGGAERVVSILLQELNQFYDVILVLMNNTVHYDLPENQKIVFLEQSKPNENGFFKFIKLPFLGLKYRYFCQQNNIDMTLSFMNRPNYIAIFSNLFGNKSRIMISERAYPSIQHQYGLQGLVNRFLISWLYPKADIIVANSFGNASDLLTNFKINNIQVINNPFDLNTIRTSSIIPINLNTQDFIFVTIGRLDKGKNHNLLIECMRNINATLWIIGDGPLRGTLNTLISQYGLETRVLLLGRQSNPFSYLAKANCFVFASNHEGFPNVIVEALACNLPIISTDCQSGPREILAPKTPYNFQLHGEIELAEYGILIPTNDQDCMREAMYLIMNDEIIRNTYKDKSKSRAVEFEKSRIIEQFIAAIES